MKHFTRLALIVSLLSVISSHLVAQDEFYNDTIANDESDSTVVEKVFGILKVNTIPKKADVYIDTIYMGQTPLTIAEMEQGEHVITMQKADYFSTTKTALVVEYKR